jgi:hypothetical protein
MNTYEIEETILKSLIDRGFKAFGVSMEIACMFEADVFGINNNGYIYEYEIKQSRSDFKADFKKKKHKYMANRDAVRVYNEWIKGRRTETKIECIKIPNRFFFVCNKGLIKPEEIPEYAGLIYISNGVMLEQKPAKLIHKTKANIGVYKSIATKMSYRMACGCKFLTNKYCNK